MSSEENSTTQNKLTLTEKEVKIVLWEEWALAIEEHFHALEMYKRNPNGTPMGHR